MGVWSDHSGSEIWTLLMMTLLRSEWTVNRHPYDDWLWTVLKSPPRLAVVSMAGLAAEGLEYDKVVGQSADLFSLQVLYEIWSDPSLIHFYVFLVITLRAMHFLFFLLLEVDKQD
jgi:hypothetical protein